MLKLPKNITSNSDAAKVAAIEAMFGLNKRPLREGGRLVVPQWPFSPGLQKALTAVCENRHLIQGLEAIEKHMDRELKGLKAMQAKPDQAQSQRLSRLVLLSNDGVERFYHNAESLLIRHADRTLGCIVLASADQLGRLFTKKENPTKALLIDDRKALEIFLSTFLD